MHHRDAYFSFLCLSVCVALRLRSLLFPPPVYVASAVFLVKPTFSLNAWSHGPQQQESRASVPTILHTIPDEPQRSIVERVTHCLAAYVFAVILPGLLLFGARDGVYCGRIQRGALLESARDRVCILLGESHPVWRRWFVGLASLLLLLAPERERSGVYFAWVILRRLTVTDACPKHREAALSNVVYSHLPLRYSSADEEHCSSPPATLAAACDMMRFRPRSSLESDETHAQAPASGS